MCPSPTLNVVGLKELSTRRQDTRDLSETFPSLDVSASEPRRETLVMGKGIKIYCELARREALLSPRVLASSFAVARFSPVFELTAIFSNSPDSADNFNAGRWSNCKSLSRLKLKKVTSHEENCRLDSTR